MYIRVIENRKTSEYSYMFEIGKWPAAIQRVTMATPAKNMPNQVSMSPQRAKPIGPASWWSWLLVTVCPVDVASVWRKTRTRPTPKTT